MKDLSPNMTLDRLAHLCGLEAALGRHLTGLEYASTHILGIGLKGSPGEDLASKCWIYFPESNCPFYRVTVFSNYSPNNVPDIRNSWSLMAEVSGSENRPVECVPDKREIGKSLPS